MEKLYGGIEAGGTKFVCALGTGTGKIVAESRFPTTTPAETLERTVDFFRAHIRENQIEAIGIASFGPVDPNPNSPTYGYITATPKPGWSNTDVAGPIRRALGVPVAFDTDVNGAALGEYRWGSGQGLSDILYLTLGTGIGGGEVVDGNLLHGLVHPEMGHIRIPHDWAADPYPGSCPFHGDCFEGLACGPAIEKRWGQRGETLPEDHPAWRLEAHYLALALTNFVCTLSPQRIIVGGGIAERPSILRLARRELQSLLNGYVHSPMITERIDEYIVPPGLGKQAGVLGAIALAERAAR